MASAPRSGAATAAINAVRRRPWPCEIRFVQPGDVITALGLTSYAEVVSSSTEEETTTVFLRTIDHAKDNITIHRHWSEIVDRHLPPYIFHNWTLGAAGGQAEVYGYNLNLLHHQRPILLGDQTVGILEPFPNISSDNHALSATLVAQALNLLATARALADHVPGGESAAGATLLALDAVRGSTPIPASWVWHSQHGLVGPPLPHGPAGAVIRIGPPPNIRKTTPPAAPGSAAWDLGAKIYRQGWLLACAPALAGAIQHFVTTRNLDYVRNTALLAITPPAYTGTIFVP
jgi:hypothetical protein